jgi:hypothetical protein
MLRRPTVKNISENELAQITAASAAQTGKTVVTKSYDPNFPVFDIPVNAKASKILIYIPNHKVMTSDGINQLRMDKFAAHPVFDGKSYDNVRCTSGVVADSLGLDGSCPLCDGINTCWTLYGKQYEDIAKTRGIDKDSADAKEMLKNERKELLSNFAIKQAEVWYTFPIVVIACEEKDGVLTTTPKLNAEGQLQGTPMWYSVREKTFLDKWEAAWDAVADEDLGDKTPAGRWVVLNYTVAGNDQPSKMQAAKALKVTYKKMGDTYVKWEEYFDKMTEAWTPAKAMETVVLDAVRSLEETQEVADAILKPVNEKITMYALASSATPAAQIAPPTADDAAAALAQFGTAPNMGVE